MRAWFHVTTVLNAAALALAGAAFGACGGGAGSANVSPESMPPTGSFTGVWFSPQYGEMHFEQNGNAVVGSYTKEERHGRIQGTAQGNLLRFTWTENREMVVGRPIKTQGRGYFQYKIGDDGRHNILGEWGIDDQETGGGPWNAYKLQNKRPNVMPPESTGESIGSGGDDGGDDTESVEDARGPDSGGDDDSDPDDALEGLDEY